MRDVVSEWSVASRAGGLERMQAFRSRMGGRYASGRNYDLGPGRHSAVSCLSPVVRRRRVLEDAAGIAGLHSRRHEAELKLKGAETNLTRVDDVIDQLAAQLQQLARQAPDLHRVALAYALLSRQAPPPALSGRSQPNIRRRNLG